MPETPHHLIQQQWANCPRTPETPFEQGDHHHDLPNVAGSHIFLLMLPIQKYKYGARNEHHSNVKESQSFVAVPYDEDEICGQYLNTDLYKCCL